MRRRPFTVGEWEVVPLEGRIVRDGDSEERLRPKAMDVLCVLAATPGEVVERDTLLGEIWGRTAVTDEPLTATVGELRRVLGDSRDAPRYIETIPKRGYRLVAAVSGDEEPGRQEEAAAEQIPRVSGIPPDDATDDSAGESAGESAGSRALHRVATGGAVLLAVAAVVAIWLLRDADLPGRPESIAILPFTVQGGAERDVFFGDGLAQEILTTLSGIGDLRVVARYSAFEFRDRGSDLAAIRNGLDVDAVLDGSIRRDGDRIRVNAQLIDARSGFNVWARTYDRRIGDAFLLQSEIATAIAGQLRVTLTNADPAAEGVEPGADAYLPYLHGRYLFESAREEEGLRQAIAYLQESLAAADDFAPAHAALAGAWMRLSDIGAILPAEGYETGARHARRALALAPDLAEAHALLGWTLLYHEWDWAGARRSLERALELAPGDAFVLNANAALNFHRGQLDRAVRLAEMATDRDPLRASPHYNLAYFRFAAGDLDGAERALERTEELSPGYPLAGLLRVQIDLARGNVALAESRSEPNPILGPMAAALTAEARGDREAALTAVRILERDHADTAPYQIAGIYARLGDREAAFRWLDRALEMRDPGLIELRADPLLEPLRDDPRYRELLGRVGFSSSAARP